MGALKNPKAERYAQERSFGLPPRAAARAAGYADGSGQPTKLESKRAVIERIEELRKEGFTEEVLIAKRQRIDGRLGQIGFGISRDFERVMTIKIDEEGKKAKYFTADLPDWGHRLNAINQLRDMHGFKGVNRVELRNLRDISTEELDAGIVERARRIVQAMDKSEGGDE